MLELLRVVIEAAELLRLVQLIGELCRTNTADAADSASASRRYRTRRKSRDRIPFRRTAAKNHSLFGMIRPPSARADIPQLVQLRCGDDPDRSQARPKCSCSPVRRTNRRRRLRRETRCRPTSSPRRASCRGGAFPRCCRRSGRASSRGVEIDVAPVGAAGVRGRKHDRLRASATIAPTARTT